MTTPEIEDPEAPVGLAELFDQLARANAESGENKMLAAGTFALYPAVGGGVVLVLQADQGPPEIVGKPLRKTIGPAMIRALQAWGDSGPNPFAFIKAMRGKGTR